MRRQLIRFTAAAGLLLLAAAATYVLAVRAGEPILRHEVEGQLSRLLKAPVSLESTLLVFDGAPGIAGEALETYRTPDGHPLFAAKRVVAHLDLVSLLSGNLRLKSLRIEGATLEIRRMAQGDWRPQALFETDALQTPPPDLERFLDPVIRLESITRGLLERSEAMLRLEIIDSRVLLFSVPQDPRENPSKLRLEEVHAELTHERSSDRSQLSWHSLLRTGENDDAPLEIEGVREGEESYRLRVQIEKAPLRPLATFFFGDSELTQAGGMLDLELTLTTDSPGSLDLAVDTTLLDLESSFSLRSESLRIQSPRLHASFQFHLDPDRIELTDATVDGLARGGRLLFAGAAQRPLRESTRIRLSAELRGAGLGQLQNIISWLPRSDAEPLERIFQRITGGQISSIGASGQLRRTQWNALLRGELTRLPRPFVLAAKVSDLAIDGAFNNALSDLSGHVEWSGDRIELRETRALWNGKPLPTLDFSAEGISHLFAGPDSLREFEVEASELPAVIPLLEWFDEIDFESRDPSAPTPEILVQLERLDHPGLRWPLRKAVLRLAPIDNGTELRIVSGQWAGAAVEGEALFLRGKNERWVVSLRMREAPAGEAPKPASAVSSPTNTWARGRIEAASLLPQGVPVLELAGDFSLRDAELHLDQFEAKLDRSGSLFGRGVLELGEKTSAHFELEAKLLAGRLEDAALWLESGEEWGRGEIDASGTIGGQFRPGTRLLETLRGRVSVTSRNGEIFYELPLALAVAQATIGFNPFASQEGTKYDSLHVDLDLAPGRISTQNFELIGRLRVFASGEVDVASDPSRIDAVVGTFFLGGVNRVLEQVPIVRNLISKKGLIGGYFAVEGPLNEPKVASLPLASIQEAVPQFLKLPFIAIGALPEDSGEKLGDDPEPAANTPATGGSP